MTEFRMPVLGADMDAGTIVEWRVAPGQRVHRGDVMAVIATDKSDIDAESFEDGVVGELVVPVGVEVPVGAVLATIVGEGFAPAVSAPAVSAPSAAAPTPVSPPAAAEPMVLSPVVRHLAEARGVDLHDVHGTGAGGLVTRTDVEATAGRSAPARPARVSPRARRLAAARGIDVETVTGSGPGGAVVGADVEAAVPREPTSPPRSTAAPREAPSTRRATIQQRIAKLMERANREIPHYWVTREIDLARCSAWLESRNADRLPADRLIAAAPLLAAVAQAASHAPQLNGRWLDGGLQTSDRVDLGIVVVLRGGGLIVPVITGADQLPVSELMARMSEVVRRARSGHLRSSELADPSITVSNLGDQGADSVFGVIYPPQVALVGFGRVVERPCVHDGMIGVHPTVTTTVAGDHRASDGHHASLFLAEVDRLLQSPEHLEEDL